MNNSIVYNTGIPVILVTTNYLVFLMPFLKTAGEVEVFAVGRMTGKTKRKLLNFSWEYITLVKLNKILSVLLSFLMVKKNEMTFSRFNVCIWLFRKAFKKTIENLTRAYAIYVICRHIKVPEF